MAGPVDFLLFEGMGMRVVAPVPKPKNNRIPDATWKKKELSRE
jgi:hypothetical protein